MLSERRRGDLATGTGTRGRDGLPPTPSTRKRSTREEDLIDVEVSARSSLILRDIPAAAISFFPFDPYPITGGESEHYVSSLYVIWKSTRACGGMVKTGLEWGCGRLCFAAGVRDLWLYGRRRAFPPSRAARFFLLCLFFRMSHVACHLTR